MIGPTIFERELRAWIRAEPTTAPWRKYLALLVAERGKLDEAIQIFESCEKDHLLAAADYRLLATWYQTQNRRDDYERARYESFKILPEGYLERLVGASCYRWRGYNNQPLPTELDESTLLAFKALFEKSAAPGSYFSQLRELYTACRDFRLLQMVPDAVLGRTPEQIYPFLERLNDNLLFEMRNEATADEIVARIKKLRDGQRTPTDLRARSVRGAGRTSLIGNPEPKRPAHRSLSGRLEAGLRSSADGQRSAVDGRLSPFARPPA